MAMVGFVFVEFAVLNPVGQQNGRRIDAAQYDLGFVPFRGSTRALAALAVTN
jgi:hypothetical protein